MDRVRFTRQFVVNVLIYVISTYKDFESKVRHWLHCDPVEALLDWGAIDDFFNEEDKMTFYAVRKRGCFGLYDPELYKQKDNDVWFSIWEYDIKNAEIVISKLISDPDIRKTLFDLRDENLEQLFDVLNDVTLSFNLWVLLCLRNFFTDNWRWNLGLQRSCPTAKRIVE